MKKTLIAAALVAAGQPLLSAADTLEQVTVTASRTETPKREVGVSVSVLTQADMQRMGYDSLLDVIRTLPGISVSNSGGAGKVSSVFIRGESNYRTLVLLDGVNIADPSAPQVGAQFQHLQVADIERIEVLRGPQGMMYGAGAGGVINIISRKTSEPLRAQLDLEAGRYGTQKTAASLGGSSDGWNYDLSISDFSTDGFNAMEADDSGERDGYDNVSGSARLGYQFNEAFSLEGQLQRTETETGYDNCGFLFFVNDCMDRYNQSSARVSGKYQQATTGHELSVASTDIEREAFAFGEPSYGFDGAISELNYIGKSALGGGQLLWGGEYEQQEFTSNFSEQDIDSLGIFAEWRSDIADKVFYTLGYRRDSLETDDHNSWRASVAYPVLLGDNQQLKYRASYGTGYRAPSPYEVGLNLSEGVEAVGPETSRGYELGLEYQLARLLQLEITYFDQEITDAIVYDYTLGSWGAYRQDDGDSYSEGIELSLNGSLGERFGWYFNGTWLDAVDTTGVQRSLVPQRVCNLGFSYSLLADKLTLNGNWRRAEDILDSSGEALDDYSKLDLNLAYRLTEKLRLTLRGENILDEDYREVGGYYTAGAAVYAGVQLTL
ncbi:TonB-dependent receptor plug domain-containing protein [Microbulbifer thermotolerans]|uniref:TonB-dependent receptor plug domain-containing protein n=1 Tax=Microbulbifer thermotolerans TaxID=252514 RepID=UPI00224B1687|nr:TonB-dependent receptor [Microbulbifer thermotolerans]MCX2834980.1 TonB-dependent receptor [Microbulbifer thermotolerans]